MSDVQRDARRRERIERLSAAAVRALADDPSLHFRGLRLYRGRQRLPLFAPHLHATPETDDFASFRGAADGLALRLTRSDPALHRAACPERPVERLVFDLLEQFRVESLASRAMPGITRNLDHRFEAWAREFHASGLTETARGILLFTVAHVCRARVTGMRIAEPVEDLLEVTRAGIAPVIGHDLVGLRRRRGDQAAYAVHALAIARTIDALADPDGDAACGERTDDGETAAFAIVMDVDRLAAEEFAKAVSGRSRVLDDADGGYRIFTSAYDRRVDVARLMRRDAAKAYRERLDARIAAQGVNVARLARDLRLLLGVPTRDGWDHGQEEGAIDGRRLAQLVASPAERRLFRTEHVEAVANCVVAFLVDCSGSMKEHAEAVAMLVDVFARALDRAGVASEVLGFTTGAWNGGRARRDWMRAGRPAHPGRLNETCQIVFKDGDASWRRARPMIAGLLKTDLYREGVDGEAVAWACGRLRAREEERRLLLVVSDGSPMDGATNLANDAHYLDHHLQDVVDREERVGDIEIVGIGVGLDLSPYYRRSHVLDLSGAVGDQAFREVVETLARRRA